MVAETLTPLSAPHRHVFAPMEWLIRAETDSRILREPHGEVARYPAVQSVNEGPPHEYRELRAPLDPSWIGRGTKTASLRVTWIPNSAPNPEAFGARLVTGLLWELLDALADWVSASG